MKWYQSKSNITVVVAAIINAASAITGFEVPPAVNEVLMLVWAIFMRQGVNKSGPEGN